jgi:hypothetical protein
MLVGFVVLLVVASRRQAALEKRINEEGIDVQAWFVMANNVLYDPDRTERYSYAVVIFTPNQRMHDLEATMEDWLSRIPDYEQPENPTEDERIFGSVMRTQVPYFQPLRLPDDITDGAEGYFISIRVYRDKLPERCITEPYVYIRVLLERKGEAIMLDYPDNDEPRRTRDD